MACETAGPPAKSNKPQQTTGGQVVVLTLANWEKEVVESPIPVLVDFTAVWCPPCKILAPRIEALAGKYDGKIKVAKFDVGDNSFHNLKPLTSKYSYVKFGGVPTVMIFKGAGPPLWTHSGADAEATYVRAIEGVLAAR
ncbi:MAG: thiol reductase thioredoxin [Gemmataceae bacterium]|nr:thiol reductase thioredoxin [Gemmataceae bacterium]